jgi:hypothetical protein
VLPAATDDESEHVARAATGEASGSECVTEAEIEAIHAEASVLMTRGIAFLDESRREAAIDALHCFDEALELRRRVPADHSAFQRYLLAACLLNRADALVRFNDRAPLAAALTSYDEAIAVLRPLPMGENPLYPRQLAMAYQNRGLALIARDEDGDVSAAADAFAGSIAVLDHEHSRGIDDRDQLRAVVWVNLANLRSIDSGVDAHLAARDAARQALAFVVDTEASDPAAADAGLRARHVLCRLCANRLSLAADEVDMPEDVHEATDAVDDGLSLVRSWEQRGAALFRPLAFDLFRFGARVYARYQPQFLEEFIDDNMNPAESSPEYVESPDMVMAALEARQLVSPEEG